MESPIEKAVVLIVDDSAMMRTLTSHVVERLGYKPLSVSNGDEAIERVSTGRCDVLLLDISMPGKSGMEVLRYIVENDYRLPVIMISGSGDIDQAVQCIKMGAYEYLTKPIDNSRLEITLKNALSESMLKQRVRLLTTAMEQSPVSVAITDIKGKIEYINPAFSRISGYSMDEVLGKRISILKSGEHSDAFYKNLWETVSRGEVWQGEFLNRKKNGELLWEQAVISPIKNNMHDISHFLALKEDITEKKKSREALAESEQRFRELSDLLPQPVFETNKDGYITYFNRAGYSVFGYKQSDLRDGLEVMRMYAPGERAKVRKNIKVRLEGRKVENHEYTAQRKNGTIFPALVYYAPIFKKESFEGLRGIVLDITRRKQAEKTLLDNQKKYRNLFHAIPDPVIVADADTGAIVQWNRRALSFFGYKSVELSSMMMASLYPENVRDKPPAFFRKQGQIKGGSVETKILTKNGFLVDVAVNSAFFETAGQKKVFGIFRDISEQKKSEQLIRENIRLKNDFIANVSHELRSPLFSILGFTSTLLRDRDELDHETIGEFLGIIHEESRRLSSLIEDVLTISRIDSGKVAYKKSALDPAVIIDSACKSLKIRAEERHIELFLDLYGSNLLVYADPDALKQVAVNLISNAIKFTSEGGKVSVTLSKNHDTMVLAVDDNGSGIPEKDLDRIFEKFYRVERPGEEIEGTGLGLPIVKEIILAHNGSIDVKSRNGFGSTFFVRLPLYRPEN